MENKSLTEQLNLPKVTRQVLDEQIFVQGQATPYEGLTDPFLESGVPTYATTWYSQPPIPDIAVGYADIPKIKKFKENDIAPCEDSWFRPNIFAGTYSNFDKQFYSLASGTGENYNPVEDITLGDELNTTKNLAQEELKDKEQAENKKVSKEIVPPVKELPKEMMEDAGYKKILLIGGLILVGYYIYTKRNK